MQNQKLKNDLKSIDLLSELPFYEGLNVIKTDNARKGYAMSNKVELVEKKDPLIQLEASKASIKNLFKDLLGEIKGFKHQVTVKSLLRKDKKKLRNRACSCLFQFNNKNSGKS